MMSLHMIIDTGTSTLEKNQFFYIRWTKSNYIILEILKKKMIAYILLYDKIENFSSACMYIFI